ncbi:MAG: MFS transporter [Cyanobacteria bacterium P01_G01_bin.54]
MTQTAFAPPARNFWHIWNMSFGFLGVQMGWTLQMANMSAIYEYLGANPEQIPILWLAAPMSGLVAQPVIGYFSDRTWTPIGRRKPYILAGAILSSLALVAMPNVSSLWMAAGLLWILDTSINLTTEPFRAFLADNSDGRTRHRAFTMQAFFIGVGAVFAACLPWLLGHFCPPPGPQEIPLAVKLSFYIGAVLFGTAVGWTVWQAPHRDEQAVRATMPGPVGDATTWYGELWQTLLATPERMRQLLGVQFSTWLGMFCVFLYLPPAIAHQVFGAVAESDPVYTQGIAWAGICIGVYNVACLLTSFFLLPRLTRRVGRRNSYALCLVCGGLSLIALLWIRNPHWILLLMLGFGVAWAGILSLPYSLVSEVLPEQHTGIYMGLFNAGIVIPQILAALSLGWIMRHWLGSVHLLVVVLGGVFFLGGAIAVQIVEDQERPIALPAPGMNTKASTS